MYKSTAICLISLWLLAGCASKQTNAQKAANSFSNKPIAEVWKEANQHYDQKDWPNSFIHYSWLAGQIKDAEVAFRLGVSAFRTHQNERAEAAFKQALAINPNHSKALYNLALMNLSAGYGYLHTYLHSLPEDKQDPGLVNTLEALERFSNQ